MNVNEVLLLTAYLPNLEYLNKVINSSTVYIEAHEHFVKQTYRNRCEILTAMGKLTLSIPLLKQSDKEIITKKRISYAENWQQQHWRSITSAYKNSPYFEFFEDDFKPFYDTKYEFLFDYNLEFLKVILHILRIKKDIQLTHEYEVNPLQMVDLRNLTSENNFNKASVTPYYQVFEGRAGFTPNLSCIDALFNVGLETLSLSGF